jgi:hypothetical protein
MYFNPIGQEVSEGAMKAIIVVTLALLLSSQAFAFRCNSGNIVVEGDSKQKVINSCGEPKSIYNSGEKGIIKSKYGRKSATHTYRQTPVEVWVLDASSNYDHVDYELTFEGEVLTKIKWIR